MFRECTELVGNGVPFDVAFSMPNDWRVAMLIIFGEMRGREFDWGGLRWRERK